MESEEELVALDPRETRPTNSWTRDQRIFLCCMYRFFKATPADYTKIFNFVFESHLQKQGFTPGTFGVRSVQSQWHDLRVKDRDEFRSVFSHPLSSDHWDSVKKGIRNAVARLGITLIKRETDDSIPDIYLRTPESLRTAHGPLLIHTRVSVREQPSSSRSRRVSDLATTATVLSPEPEISVAPNDMDIEAHTEEEKSLLCTKSGCFWCFKEGLLSPEDDMVEDLEAAWNISPSSPVHVQHSSGGVPRTLYRWFNLESQGVNSRSMMLAGMFADTTTRSKSPQDFSDAQFREMFVNHASINHAPSPFISVFRSLLAPVHRGLRAEAAAVAVIDTSEMDHTQIFSAEHLVRETSLQIRSYKGFGEYLVWRVIPTDAIKCVFKISDLMKITNEHPDINSLLQLDVLKSQLLCRSYTRRQLRDTTSGSYDRASGTSVGKLLSLLGIPREMVGSVARKVALNWQFRKIPGGHKEFFNGVYGEWSMLSPTPQAPLVTFDLTEDIDDDEADDHDFEDGGDDDDDNRDDNVQEPEDTRKTVIQDAPSETTSVVTSGEDLLDIDLNFLETDFLDSPTSAPETPCPVGTKHSLSNKVSIERTTISSVTATSPSRNLVLYNPRTEEWSRWGLQQTSTPLTSPEVIVIDDIDDDGNNGQTIDRVGNLESSRHEPTNPRNMDNIQVLIPRRRFEEERAQIRRILPSNFT
ncbi:hypothetical protein ASPZODRAFT_141696 [Penicilliopsis zonata CBS 506.65]|uniref:DUF7587 domain-containing protein n=1 Tax=Penicilliopsis zonata CBS 506.65 TaxID=1073090 RepID=A0A1L9SIK5_9EURO|nr:hypothetical protein ASPZODRAFT_141696 [Penicilliopsis zonata CBS 506.65]OJJ46913.1 hypothetical protein ASPZODRAFT_141696 [Penicilliopsis zonata CBS 506.65]